MSITIGVDFQDYATVGGKLLTVGGVGVFRASKIINAFVQNVVPFLPKYDEDGDLPLCKLFTSKSAPLLQIVLVPASFASKVAGVDRQTWIEDELISLLTKYDSALGVIVITLPTIEAKNPAFAARGLDKLPNPVKIWEDQTKQRWVDFDCSNLDTFQPEDDRMVVATRISECVKQLDLSNPKIVERLIKGLELTEEVTSSKTKSEFLATNGPYPNKSNKKADDYIRSVVDFDSVRLNPRTGVAPIEWLKYHKIWSCTQTKQMHFNIYQISDDLSVTKKRVQFEKFGHAKETDTDTETAVGTWTLVSRVGEPKIGNDFATQEQNRTARMKGPPTALTWSIGNSKNFSPCAEKIRKLVLNPSPYLYSAEWRALATQGFVPGLEELLLATLWSNKEDGAKGYYAPFPLDPFKGSDALTPLEKRNRSKYAEDFEALSGRYHGFVGFSLVYQKHEKTWNKSQKSHDPVCNLETFVTVLGQGHYSKQLHPQIIDISVYTTTGRTLKTSSVYTLTGMLTFLEKIERIQNADKRVVCAVQLLYNKTADKKTAAGRMIFTKVTVPILPMRAEARDYLSVQQPTRAEVINVVKNAPELIDLDGLIDNDIPLLKGLNLERQPETGVAMGYNAYSTLLRNVRDSEANRALDMVIGRFAGLTETSTLYVFEESSVRNIKHEGSLLNIAANLCFYGSQWLKKMNYTNTVRMGIGMSDIPLVVNFGDLRGGNESKSAKDVYEIREIQDLERQHFGLQSVGHFASRRTLQRLAWVSFKSDQTGKRNLVLLECDHLLDDYPDSYEVRATLASRQYNDDFAEDVNEKAYTFEDVNGATFKILCPKDLKVPMEYAAELDFLQQRWKMAAEGLRAIELSKMVDKICFLAGAGTLKLYDASQLTFNDRTEGSEPAIIRGSTYSFLKEGQPMFYMNKKSHGYWLAIVENRIRGPLEFKKICPGLSDEYAVADNSVLFMVTEEYDGRVDQMISDSVPEKDVVLKQYIREKNVFEAVAFLALSFFSGRLFLECCKKRFVAQFGAMVITPPSAIANKAKYVLGKDIKTLAEALLAFEELAETHSDIFDSTSFFKEIVDMMFMDARPMSATNSLFNAFRRNYMGIPKTPVNLEGLTKNLERCFASDDPALAFELIADDALECIIALSGAAKRVKTHSLFVKTRAQMVRLERNVKRERFAGETAAVGSADAASEKEPDPKRPKLEANYNQAPRAAPVPSTKLRRVPAETGPGEWDDL